MCTTMYLVGSVLLSAVTYFIGSYSKEKGKNAALKEDIGKITALAEKAKNAATIEDIGKITQIVEDVKSEFKANNEILRSTLDLKSQHTIRLKNIEIDAYMEYNKNVSTWLSNITGFPFSGYNLENYEDIETAFKTQLSNFNNLNDIAFAQLHFFEHDVDFYDNIIKELKIGLIEMTTLLNQAVANIEKEFNDAKWDLSRLLPEELKKNLERREVMYNNLKLIREEYYSEMLAKYEIVNKYYKKFTAYAKRKISQLEGV